MTTTSRAVCPNRISMVWVVHPIRQDDVSAARKWGEFQFINERYVYGDELVTRAETGVGAHYEIPRHEYDNLLLAAQRFDGDRDYLLIAGDHLQLICFTGLISRRCAEFGVLRYDKKIADYIPVRLHMGIVRRAESVLASSSNIGDRHGQDGNQGESLHETHPPYDSDPWDPRTR